MPDGTDLDLAAPLKAAIQTNAELVALLGTYLDGPAVFTARPVPEDAPYPMIIVNPTSGIGNGDYLTTRLPIVLRDIAVYGEQPDQYRAVEKIGFMLRQQFHRPLQPNAAVEIPGFSIIDIVARGPIPAPADDAQHVGRMVLLTFRLRDLAT